MATFRMPFVTDEQLRKLAEDYLAKQHPPMCLMTARQYAAWQDVRAIIDSLDALSHRPSGSGTR